MNFIAKCSEASIRDTAQALGACTCTKAFAPSRIEARCSHRRDTSQSAASRLHTKQTQFSRPTATTRTHDSTMMGVIEKSTCAGGALFLAMQIISYKRICEFDLRVLLALLPHLHILALLPLYTLFPTHLTPHVEDPQPCLQASRQSRSKTSSLRRSITRSSRVGRKQTLFTTVDMLISACRFRVEYTCKALGSSRESPPQLA